MMRSLLFVGGLFLASGSEVATCVVDGAEAADELLDASVYIWAASKRCGKTNEKVNCEIDISSAIESVNGMINVILKTVSKCGGLHTENSACGMAASELTQSVSGIAAASGEVITKCPNKLQPKIPKGAPSSWKHANKALCVVDIKDSVRALMRSIKAFSSVRKNCETEGTHDCTHNALQIVAGLASMGEYLTGAVGHCSCPDGSSTCKKMETAACAGASAMLIHHVTKVADAGRDMSQKCGLKAPKKAAKETTVVSVPVEEVVPAQRLYVEDDAPQTASPVSSNLVLGAFLPLTAVVSFVGGRFYASRRTHEAVEMIEE